MSRQRRYTRAELQQLDRYDQGVSIADIARAIGVRESTVTYWLKNLGMYHAKNNYGTRELPWASPLRCRVCGIILARADEGYHGDKCNACWEQLTMEAPAREYDPTARLVALEDAQRF